MSCPSLSGTITFKNSKDVPFSGGLHHLQTVPFLNLRNQVNNQWPLKPVDLPTHVFLSFVVQQTRYARQYDLTPVLQLQQGRLFPDLSP